MFAQSQIEVSPSNAGLPLRSSFETYSKVAAKLDVSSSSIGPRAERPAD